MILDFFSYLTTKYLLYAVLERETKLEQVIEDNVESDKHVLEVGHKESLHYVDKCKPL